MEDPVIDCLNHTYERHAIETALLHRPGFCPFTNERYPGGDAKLHSNLALRQTIEAMVPLTQRPAHDVSDGGGRERPRGESHAAARDKYDFYHVGWARQGFLPSSPTAGEIDTEQRERCEWADGIGGGESDVSCGAAAPDVADT